MEVPLWLSVCLTVLCAILSAVFSGLTLGLLSLSIVQLKLLIKQRDKTPSEEKLARAAERVLAVRKDGNYLLVTLLIGNVAVNTAFSILISDITDGVTGFLISTIVITLFGEIVPQSICARHGLRIGGFFYPFVRGLEYLLFPLVKPIAFALNYLLGEDMGTLYSKKQLQALLDYHGGDANILSKDETRILTGGLNIALLKAEDAMTKIEDVFGIYVDSTFNLETTTAILNAGYSRIPILDKSKPQCVIGLLFVKDLVLVDPAAELPVRDVLAVFGRRIYAVDYDVHLLSLLADFKKGETHLAVVRRVVTDTTSDPFYEHVGIITLEDVLEEILQDEIQDEFDRKEDNETKLKHKAIKSVENEDRLSLLSGKIRLFDRRRYREPLDTQEALAVSSYLSESHPGFTTSLIHPKLLHKIVLHLPVLTSPAGTLLYKMNTETQFAILVLMGTVVLHTGNETVGKEVGPWTIIGDSVLALPQPLYALFASSSSSMCVDDLPSTLTPEDGEEPPRTDKVLPPPLPSRRRADSKANATEDKRRRSRRSIGSEITIDKNPREIKRIDYSPLKAVDSCDEMELHGMKTKDKQQPSAKDAKEIELLPMEPPMNNVAERADDSAKKAAQLNSNESNQSNMFLQKLDKLLNEWDVAFKYFPEFFATAKTDCRLLIINRSSYSKAIKASVLYNRGYVKSKSTEKRVGSDILHTETLLPQEEDDESSLHRSLVELNGNKKPTELKEYIFVNMD